MSTKTDQKKLFTHHLLEWNKDNDRTMPWKGEKDPYLIWLSEIMMQQTRVEQGLPYFVKFKEHYPGVKHLADAPEDEVMKMWQGLGYYSRARNLHSTAKHIAYKLNGQFPKTYEDILALKGVGPYTAAAISSFAYGIPKAVVDGNVIRVLARFFGVELAFDSSEGKKYFQQLADELIAPKQPGTYNQAIMDFGAKVCTPKKPNCLFCPLADECHARLMGKIDQLPYRSKKLKRRKRYFYYMVVETPKGFLLEKRTEKDIWQNLYQFPLLETEKKLSQKALKAQQWSLDGADILEQTALSDEYKQTLSHQDIYARFVRLKGRLIPNAQLNGLQAVKLQNLDTFAFPKIVDWYLRDNSLILEK